MLYLFGGIVTLLIAGVVGYLTYDRLVKKVVNTELTRNENRREDEELRRDAEPESPDT